ncbi:hypothetical protein JCM21900_003297, partial [Sporobolomyces salmonicolor]
MTVIASPAILQAAASLAQSHHAPYDPSHDWHHVHRVRLQALRLARSLSPSPDLLVVELSALFHDLLDAKYLRLEPGQKPPTAREHLEPFWASFSDEVVSERQRRLVERVIENVSYSKEVKRIKAGEETDWHSECLELHCVQDADKLDAIGAFGILRCAAYSGASSVPLFVPPSSSRLSSSPSSLGSTSIAPAPAKSSAIDHFHEKLLRLEGMMKTPLGRTMARKRTEMMREFVGEVEREWNEISGGDE